jgi:hypothetical protein
MPIVYIEPTDEHPVPYDISDEVSPTFLEEMAVAGATVELQIDLGASLELEPDEADKQKTLLNEVIKNQKLKNLRDPNTAFAAAAFLRTYGAQLALDAASARAAITNKLMEIANCGDPKFELKALELLGKHSDIGIFTERSEITINYKNPEDLENAIKERVKRLLNANIIDITPLEASLDDELGLNKRDDFDELGLDKRPDVDAEDTGTEEGETP